MMLGGWTMAGVLGGTLCWRIALAYDALVQGGAYPDSVTLAHAVSHAFYRERRFIIGPRFATCAQARVASAGIAAAFAGAVCAFFVMHGHQPFFFVLPAVGLALVLLACIDARTGLLPDAVTLPLLWAGLIAGWLAVGADVQWRMGGVLTGYAVPQVLRLAWWQLRRQEGMGRGDVKLLAALGAWVGMDHIVHVLLLACVGGVGFAIVRLRGRPWLQRLQGHALPLGPFISLAGMAVLLRPSAVQSWF